MSFSCRVFPIYRFNFGNTQGGVRHFGLGEAKILPSGPAAKRTVDRSTQLDKKYDLKCEEKRNMICCVVHPGREI